ncbi:MAG: hypothetical protein AAGE85_11175 [Pseudomonadota bacterium]
MRSSRSAPPHYSIALLTLIHTLFDIALLRRGPEALPKSWLVLYLALALWFGGILLIKLSSPTLSFASLFADIAGWLASVALFAVIISAAGFKARLLQSLSAIIGAGAVILCGQIVAGALAALLQSDGGALLVREVLLLWAVFVKGYILAAAINAKALIGVLLSIVVFVARLIVSQSLAPATA